MSWISVNNLIIMNSSDSLDVRSLTSIANRVNDIDHASQTVIHGGN